MRIRGLHLIILLLLSATALKVCAGPVINEFMASNDSIYPDNCDFDDYSDWIELYNPETNAVSLTDYYLTDDLTLPLKWKIPAGASIPAEGYFMVRADGFNAGPGETHGRDYYPVDSTFVTKRYHAGFKLSAGGESLGIYRVTAAPEENTLIATDAVWKYLDTGEDPGADWMKLTFDDSIWLSGAAELGYGDSDETTTVSYGPDSGAKYPTTHFRTHFTQTDPSMLAGISFRAKIDDGAIFYLNGSEVARVRMQDGDVSYLDYTSAGGSDYSFEYIDLPASAFRAGDNVLAVEVHQNSGTSSDISLNAELIVSEISPADIVKIDALTNFPSQITDISYGRDPASTNGWSFFAEPTPEGDNTTEALSDFVNAPAVTASLDSGFYEGTQTVSLVTSDAAIHYTLDGSVPSSSSPVYSNALTVAATTILRARTFETGKIPGAMLTRTYFIDETTTLPVFSFVTDPANLFDDTFGIAENNTDYPFKGREIPIRLEMFEADKTPAFAVSAGAKIAGENIWRKDQKPFNIYMRGKYGDDLLNYQMFPGQPVASFGEFSLRNGGDDWEETLLRDAMMPFILDGQMDAGLYSYRPSIMFLNGELWGIYNIRKRFDENYFFNEHQLSDGEYEQLGYINDFVNDIAYGTATPLTAETGDTDGYEALLAFCTTNDTADAIVYAQIEEQMNIDSFIDWALCADFPLNTSWAHNREFWHATSEGAKWQWVINDFDRGLDVDYLDGAGTKSLIDDFVNDEPLFEQLSSSPHFVNRLLQRYAAHIGSTFDPQRISDMLDILTAEQDAEVARHMAKWPGSMATRDAQIAEIKEYFSVRPSSALERAALYLGVNESLSPLTITAAPATGGIIRVAGVKMQPEYNTAINLFENIPVELTAEPAPGYAFAGWSNGNTNTTIEVTLTAVGSISANFTAGAETIIPSTISSDLTLTAAGSPYSVTNDLWIEAGATLTLKAGVTLNMPEGKSILVNGVLNAAGSESLPVSIGARTDKAWGNLSFVNAEGESTLSYLTIRDASPSRSDPLNLKAAVSGYNSSIVLDHCDIEALLPVFSRYGSTTLRNSTIHILFSGDGINIKSGDGLVDNCTFLGNSSPDTDAIDFDNVVDGQISRNRIYAFYGFNSDAIDVGEGCVDLMVVSNRIFNCTDKGVSVGQASVAYIQRNLIVDCDMGIGIKDSGSTAYIDQNTFAQDNIGVASFEKNEGAGGGIAYIQNCIFSRSKDEPVYVDALSVLTVDYSLSDTLALAGTGNLLTDPLFTDEGSYDFSLTAESPAIDSGDPAHAPDTDGSRADMGAYYTFDPEDYPYFIPNLVVINEVLAHSHDIAPDWIELYNSSSKPVDLSGWYLSDDPDQPMKYRIADGTELSANGYIVFYEDENFGAESSDAGALIPFALSENGDTVNVYGPGNELRPDYTEKETFGASLRGVSKGRYYKASTRTYNFIAMETATPGASNSDPKVGPIVISEIMYHPPVSEAEYLELANISSNAVTLYDETMDAGWSFTQGLDHEFSTTAPITMQAGERILLVRNATAFATEYGAPDGTQIIQWDSGALDNGGETLQLSMPGDTNEVGELQFIRIDRVDYSDDEPWPTGPDGDGTSLARINENAYGNDVANWRESVVTPALTGFQQWLTQQTLPDGEDGLYDDPDGDGIPTGFEYAIGTDPMTFSAMVGGYDIFATPSTVSFILPVTRPDLGYIIQRTTSLVDPDWTDLSGTVYTLNGETGIDAVDPQTGNQGYYRLKVILYNQ